MADGTKKTTVYEDIKALLRARIEQGELAAGERVPSEYELGRQLGVSRHRTRLALRELEVEGYVVRRRGSGTYVAPVQGAFSASQPGLANTVVILFPKFENRYARRVVEGFIAYMGQASTPSIAYNFYSDHESEVKAMRSIVDSGVLGLVAWLEHDTPTTRAFLDSLRRRRFPIALVDRYFEGQSIDYVVSSNESMSYAITKALIEKGHRRIAFAGHKPSVSSVLDRYRGYERAMCEAAGDGGEAVDHALVLDLDAIWDNSRVTIRDVMALRDKPTAFVCMHDKVMQAVYRETLALGYSTPDEIAFASVDDMHPAGEQPPVPGAITVAQDAITVGAESARVLKDRIANPDAPVQCVYIEGGPIMGVGLTGCNTSSTSA
ncbi:MAG: GntR family transcriptional regulator [Candidatus Hydrogenedentes bacterium]|nr:GntR family transcriptional regulator [Candidatus Hydrogenedentota bacterium]